MATQTETQRKAAAQKAAATRRANAAKRSQSARKAAETRARAQLNLVQVAGLQAERAGDVALGAVLTARDRVVDTTRRFSAPSTEWTALRKRIDTSTGKFERRGAQIRKRGQRRVTQTFRRTRRDVEKQANQVQRDVESTVTDVRETAEELAGRVGIG
jgi:hypothetical protein